MTNILVFLIFYFCFWVFGKLETTTKRRWCLQHAARWDPFQWVSGVGGARSTTCVKQLVSFLQRNCGDGKIGRENATTLCAICCFKGASKQGSLRFISLYMGLSLEKRQTAMSSTAARCDQLVRRERKNAGGRGGGCCCCTTGANYHRQVLAGLWTARRRGGDCCWSCCLSSTWPSSATN